MAWNGLSIQKALALIATIWAGESHSPDRRRPDARKYHYLTRDPFRTVISLTFRSPGEEETKPIQLNAVEDQLNSLKADLPPEKELSDFFHSPVLYEVLPDAYGYIQITGFMATLGGIQL